MRGNRVAGWTRSGSLLVVGLIVGALSLAPVWAGPNDPVTNKKFKKTVKKLKAMDTSLQAMDTSLQAMDTSLQGQITTVQGNTFTKAEADARYAKHYYRRSPAIPVPPSGFAFGEVACPPGTEATGGGGFASGPNISLHASMPTDGTGVWIASTGAMGAGFTAWGGIGVETGGFGGSFTLWVICQDAQSIDANYAPGSTSYGADRGPSRGGWEAG